MTANNNHSYEFGPYCLNPSQRVLTREGETISLTPKATELLIMLVAHAGQLVEKDELLKEIWPDTFVEEANLTQNIFLLRRALGDERAGPKYIETVARRGYRFIAPVKAINSDDSAHSPTMWTAHPRSPVVAVLPFVSTGGDPEIDYLADGITANLINNLSHVSKLRVMSRSRVFRYNIFEVDPQQVGKELGASAVLVGKVHSRPPYASIDVEFIDTSTGWQLWGETFNFAHSDLLKIEEAITRNLLEALRLRLTGEEEKQITTRYTQNVDAYRAYLAGRHHWSRYTKISVQEAIHHFQHAIKVDPNYALAYAAAIDSYLRLVTNYLPPERNRAKFIPKVNPKLDGELDPRLQLRFEWDWKAAERELLRANDLKVDYPAAYQWYAAYRFALELFQESFGKSKLAAESLDKFQPTQLHSETLSPNEEVQILCLIAREQVEVGNYEAGCLVLKRYWTPGDWPKLDGLRSQSAADLLFTTGFLAGCLASTGRLQKGQKHAEALLSGSIGIFEQLGAKRSAAEAKSELALSYYRQGMFEAARNLLLKLIQPLQAMDNDLRSLALVRLAVVERQAGHITDSLSRLSVASTIIDKIGPFVTSRYYHELAAGLKDAAITDNRSDSLEVVSENFARAYYEFEAVGHFRYTAVVENNHGYLLLDVHRYDEAEIHLLHAHELFGHLEDTLRQAQVDDCLSRLYMATNRFELAETTIDKAISSLEADDEEALLAEALTTKGLLFFNLKRHDEARRILEGAWRIAERCGDNEGAGRALLILVEEMHNQLDTTERNLMATRIQKLLEGTQQAATRTRLTKCLERILPNSS